MKIGLTGATGMLGAAVVEVLREAGHQVLALRHRREVPASCTVVQGSLEDPVALARAWEGAGAIIHLAGIFGGSEDELRRTNVEGTRAVAEASQRLGARLVVAGSATVYAPGEMVEAEEDFPPGPVDAYGMSKALAEEQLPQEACVFRLPTLISVDACPFRESLCGLVRAAPVPRLEDGGAPIELAPVRDVARGMLLAVEKGDAAGAFHVSGARRARFVELIEGAASALGLEPRWAPPEQVDPLILRQARETRTLSLGRAERELGYQPREDWREVLFPEAAGGS